MLGRGAGAVEDALHADGGGGEGGGEEGGGEGVVGGGEGGGCREGEGRLQPHSVSRPPESCRCCTSRSTNGKFSLMSTTMPLLHHPLAPPVLLRGIHHQGGAHGAINSKTTNQPKTKLHYPHYPQTHPHAAEEGGATYVPIEKRPHTPN